MYSGWAAKLVRQENKEQGLVHLQGWGSTPAIPASELRPGMVRLYNQGSSLISEVRQEGKWIYVTTPCDSVGPEWWTRRHRMDTMIPVKMIRGTHTPVLQEVAR